MIYLIASSIFVFVVSFMINGSKPHLFWLALIPLVFGFCFYAISIRFQAVDYELWNGSISNKYQITKKCQTGWNTSQDSFCDVYDTRSVYDGQTCTGTGKDRVCFSQYHTEYRYNFPWERKWYVEASNLKTTWKIDRIDSQGAKEPPLWTKTNIGDPASIVNRYNNWVKAASDSLFHQDAFTEEKYKDILVQYPLELTNIWTAHRVLAIDIDIPNINDINYELGKLLGFLGPEKQMNIILMFVSDKYDSDIAYAYRRHWQGFKKNDVVVFIGTNGKTITWSEVLSWSKNSQFNIELRDAILGMKNLDYMSLLARIKDTSILYYERREMKDFEYLKSELPFNWFIFSLFMASNLIYLGFIKYFRKDFI